MKPLIYLLTALLVITNVIYSGVLVASSLPRPKEIAQVSSLCSSKVQTSKTSCSFRLTQFLQQAYSDVLVLGQLLIGSLFSFLAWFAFPKPAEVFFRPPISQHI